MKILVEKIDPERAKKLLAMNTGNFRKINRKRVAQYASDMSSNLWEANGETIKINGNELKDGQHRLLAVIESGATITTGVAYDVDGDCLHVDQGGKRTIGDWLQHFGVKNARTVGSAGRLILCHANDRWNWNEPSNTYIQLDELIAFCRKNSEQIIASVRLAAHVQSAPSDVKLSVSHSILAAVLYLGSKNNDASCSTNAKWFVERLVDGTNLSPLDAVYHFRNKAIASGASVVGRWSPEVQRALLSLAWNKTVKGEQTKQLKIAATGPSAGKVPSIINESNVL